MSRRGRLILFSLGGAGFALLLAWGLAGLPGFGRYPGPYGDLVNASAVPERHVTDTVTAVNLDYRGLDTIGEEFILFAAVAGAATLLRKLRGEHGAPPVDEIAGRRSPLRDEAVTLAAVPSVAALVAFGLYVVGHGQLTPGGGFQGGAILAGGVLLVYLAGGFPAFRRLAGQARLEVAEAAGAGGFVVVGLASLALGAAFLQDVLPLGSIGVIASAGTLPIINAAIGLEVAAGFVLVLLEFLVQLIVLRDNQTDGGGEAAGRRVAHRPRGGAR